MLRYFFTIAFLIYLTSSFGNSRPSPVDSLGIEKKNGKTFVLHKVEQGETLYSILRRYGSSEKEFYSANPDFNKTPIVNSNQVIAIPIQVKSKAVPRPRVIEIQELSADSVSPKGVIDENGIEVIDVPEATPKEAPIAENTVKPEIATRVIDPHLKTHKVGAGEGLYGIATKYKVKVAQLREWNKLASDVLHIDQVLIVGKTGRVAVAAVTKEDKKEKEVGIAKTTPALVESVEKPKPVVTPVVDVENSNQQVVNKPFASDPQRVVTNAPLGKKYSELGIAEVIEAGTNTNKYLALHRTAPVGTLIKIVNEANGQSVWVKVIGKLTGPGDVIIKISPMAFQKLQPRDKRIRASLSYAL